MEIELTGSQPLRFDDGSPVRAASAIARLGDGLLVAQDDSTDAAWWKPDATDRIRVFPSVEGHDVFSEDRGTKHLKPDLEAACEVSVGPAPGVVLLGSGSTPRRMRGALVVAEGNAVRVVTAELGALYDMAAAALGLEVSQLNIEGSCRQGERLRLFHRGNSHAGVPSASVDVDLSALVEVVVGRRPVDRIGISRPRTYALGEVYGVGLAITDAVSLPDGRILASAAAEDTPNAVDDGPVVATALVLLDDDRVEAIALLPHGGGPAHKVEGLAVREVTADGIAVTAVVDADDPALPSTALDLAVRWRRPCG